MSFEILFCFVFFNSFGLHGCNQEGEETWGTEHHRTRSQRGGGGVTRPLIYLFAPLLFQALEKKAKKRVQKGEKGYHELTSSYKERISWRIWPWEDLQACYGKKS